MTDDEIEYVDCCPDCETHRIRERKTKTPTYRCSLCGFEFDEPATRRARYHKQVEPDETYPDGTYDELKTALRRTVEAGSRHARSGLIANYTDELCSQEIGSLLAEWGVDDGLVSIRHQNTSYTLWRIEIDTQNTGHQEAVADD